MNWEYKVISIDHDQDAVNKAMSEWAAAGWELMSGNTSTIPYFNEARTRYTLFWRKTT
jgi:hypothetical protein